MMEHRCVLVANQPCAAKCHRLASRAGVKLGIVSGSLRIVLVVVGVGLPVGFGILGWRLTEGVRRQRIGATVIRRPGLRRMPSAVPDGMTKGTRTQVRRLNLAPLATVTASSVQEGIQTSEGVADDRPDERQWVSAGETAGAWIQLEWDEPVLVSEVELHDRPSLTENILAGSLLFDEGSAISVPPLPPDGSAWRTAFPPRAIRRLRFRIDTVAGRSTGLAEIRVYGPLPE